MLNNYKQEYENIKVPSSLKTETLLKMKEAEEKKPRFSMKFAFTMMSTLLISAGLLYGLFTQKTQNGLKEGEIIAKHTIDEGELFFEKEAGKNLFGNEMQTSEMKTIGKIEAQSLSGKSFEEFKLKGLTLMKKEYFAYYQQEQLLKVEWVYSYEAKGKELQVHYYSDAKEIATNSTIEDKEVAIYYDGEGRNATFDSYFLHELGMVEITGYGIIQQEYIDYLVKIVKNSN